MNIKKFLKIILIGILISVWFINFSANYEPVTSGIRKIEYKVKWCNPIFGCKEWYFSSLNAVIWPNYNNWFVVSSNRKVICNWDCGNRNIFKTIFNNLKLKWEWVYTITIHTYDNVKRWKVRDCNWNLVGPYYWNAPGNCSTLKLVYKIDKTHPNVIDPLKSNSSYPEIDETSKYVYIWRSKKQTNIYDFDANDNNWGWNTEKFIKWSVSNILDNPISHAVIRKNLKTIYYSNSNENITIKFDLKNYFPSDEPYWNWNISKLKKIELLNWNHSLLKVWDLNVATSPNWQITDKIKNLFWDVDEKIFYFRIWDEAWNYSEVPVYIVKDTTAPITLNEFLNTFKFVDNWEKIFYTTNTIWPSIDWRFSIPSKFFAADDNLKISFALSDKKEGGDNTHNAWILRFKIMIEKANSCNSFQDYILNPDDLLQQENQTTIQKYWQITHNFSKVDNCLQNSEKTYRYYKVRVISIDDDWNEIWDKICDKVGNCTEIAPLVFRVVANKIDFVNSTISVNTNLTNNRILANWKSSYNFSIVLKDKYNNKVVPVWSDEDDKLVKSVKLTFNFDNGLYLDQINKSGLFGVFKEDIEADDKVTFSNLRLADSFYLMEDEKSSPNGVYKFKIYSLVPTFDYYPWEGNDAKLILKTINFLVKDETSWNITKDNDIWQWNDNKFNSSLQEIKLNKWNLWYIDTVNDYLSVNSNNYWKVVSNPLNSISSINSKNKRIKLWFASPVIVGLYNIKKLTEGVKNIYSYKIWNFDTSSITVNNFEIYEKWFTNSLYDFYHGSWSVEINNSSESVDLIWKDFDSAPNLAIFSSLNWQPKIISKYTKLIIDPTLAGLIDPSKTALAVGTKLFYKINNDLVILPSDWRGVNNSKNKDTGKFDDSTAEYWDSWNLFSADKFTSSNYSDYNTSELSPLVQSIKVVWNIQAKWRVWQRWDIIKDKHVNIWWDIKKWQVKANVKRKVTILMRWRKWCNGNYNATDSFLACKFNYNGEEIIPIRGNLTFNGDYKIEWRKTFVIMDWNVFIKGNLYKKTKSDILTLIVLNEDWFSTNSVDFEFIKSKSVKWFVYISPKVTNIDAFIFAEWSLVSWNPDSDKVFYWWNITDTDKDIYNQLYIRWWIISTNTIWWSRLLNESDIPFNQKCPWFLKESNCNVDVAQAFDLIYLRRYMLVSADIYWWPAGKEVPYLPVSIANNISSYNSNHPYMWWKKYCEISASNVDCSKDADSDLPNIPENAKQYPLYIEFDPIIQSRTSVFFTK